MSPLEAATVDELTAELKKRGSAVVVALMKPHPTQDRTFYSVWWSGPVIAALGLAHHARQRISLATMTADDVPDEEVDGN